MNRLEHQIERNLRQIADRATPSPDAWNSILTRIADQDPDTETEIIMLTEATPRSTRRWLLLASAAAAVVAIIGAAVIAFALNDTSSDDDQTPSPAAATTVAPTRLSHRRRRPFASPQSADVPAVTFIVPAGWTADSWAVYKAAAEPTRIISGSAASGCISRK